MAQRTGKQNAGRLTSVAYGLDGDPDAVDTVQRIFAEFVRLYADATLSEIARDLNTDEVRTQRGGKWHAATVRYILRNVSYTPDVIDTSTFEAAQRRLQALRSGPPKKDTTQETVTMAQTE